MGTAVGTSVYNHHGWRAAAALNVGWQGFCVLALLIRGPYCPRYTWLGYKGGLRAQKHDTVAQPSGDSNNIPNSKPEKELDEKTVETVAEGRNDASVGSVDEAQVHTRVEESCRKEDAGIRK
jgi:hypothetical protein